jgi:hypothetical protein
MTCPVSTSCWGADIAELIPAPTNAGSPFALGSEVPALAANVAHGEEVEADTVLQGIRREGGVLASCRKEPADHVDLATCK